MKQSVSVSLLVSGLSPVSVWAYLLVSALSPVSVSVSLLVSVWEELLRSR